MAIQETISIGTVLGEFEIEKILGRGGMGVVYKAHETSLNRKVALKVLSHMLSTDNEFITRFKKEAQIIAALNHPNIVSILSFGKDLNHYYFAMEYIKGRDLDQILKEKKTIPLEEALTIARQVADALSEAGKKGVVHRDLKPANIMMDEMNRIRVTDFGVARIESANDNLTKTGMFLGSPQYASPEQAEGLPIDTRSDIYALGAVLYRMLAGTPPTTGDSPLAVVVKIVSETVVPIEQVNSSVPEPVCSLIGKMMAKDLKQRYQSHEEVVTAIDNYLRILKSSKTGESEHNMSQPPPLPTTTAPKQNFQIQALAGGGICILILLLVFLGKSSFFSKDSKELSKTNIQQQTSLVPKNILEDKPVAPAPQDSLPQSEITLQDKTTTETKTAPHSLVQPITDTVEQAQSKTDKQPPVVEINQFTKRATASKNHAQPVNDLPDNKNSILTSGSNNLEEKSATIDTLANKISPATTPKTAINTSQKATNYIPAEEQNLKLPNNPAILLIVTGPDEMTMPLQAHLESTLLDSSLQVISPTDVPILYKKMQIGDMPVNWYNINQLTPSGAAHVLVLAKIQKTGSTLLRFYGTSQEQISAIFSVRILDMSTGKLVERSINGTIRYTVLNMQEEFQETLDTTVNKLGDSIHNFWNTKKKNDDNHTPAEPSKTLKKTKLNV